VAGSWAPGLSMAQWAGLASRDRFKEGRPHAKAKEVCGDTRPLKRDKRAGAFLLTFFFAGVQDLNGIYHLKYMATEQDRCVKVSNRFRHVQIRNTSRYSK
jgi:hypothetical protein